MAQSWINVSIFRRGLKNSIGVAGFVLAMASVGVGAIARDYGLDVISTLFMTIVIWAVPSQVILLTMMAAGASLPEAFLAVTLSAVRLMPMVTSLLPDVRTVKTPRWVLLVIAHMTAATVWLETRRRSADIPKSERAGFVFSMSIGLISMLTAGVLLGYALSAIFPPLLSAGLIFVTPVYFIIALLIAARIPADYLAIIFGAVLGPVFAYLTPRLDLLLAGLIGGSAAYIFYRIHKRRSV